MPFTLSHPAAGAPFWPLVRRGYLPLCALAIGAMSPDFEYLLRLRTEWHWGHSVSGMFTFCLPVGLCVTALWVGLVRTPLRRLLALRPEPLQPTGRWWFGAAIAVLIGAFTHLIWDGVTHGFPWADRLIPGLRHLVSFGGVRMPVYDLLQNLSTVAGGMIVLAWLWQEMRSGAPRELLAGWRVAVVLFLGMIVAGFAVWNALRAGATFQHWPMQWRVAQASVGGLLGLAIGLVLYAGAYQVTRSQPSSLEEPRIR